MASSRLIHNSCTSKKGSRQNRLHQTRNQTMRSLRFSLLLLTLLIGVANPAHARVNLNINLSLFPDFVAVPGYPVYYAPRVDGNFFFYDGMYWVYQDDDWYVSDWYNGPWDYVEPDDVPVFVLRIPVRYYRRPPIYFREWRADGPPRWEHRWGNDWERHHSGWDRWDHRSPPPAPLPNYQRHYSGDRYPDRDEQRNIHDRSYRYQPQNNDVHERYRGSSEREQPHPSRDDQQPQWQHQQQPNDADRHAQPQRGGDQGQRPMQQRIPYQQREPAVQQQTPRDEAQPEQHREHDQGRDDHGDRGQGDGHGRGGNR
jgi:hypothetical protein